MVRNRWVPTAARPLRGFATPLASARVVDRTVRSPYFRRGATLNKAEKSLLYFPTNFIYMIHKETRAPRTRSFQPQLTESPLYFPNSLYFASVDG